MQRESGEDLNSFRRETGSGRAHRSEAGTPTPRRVDLGDDYDPHLFRQVPNPTNDLETLFHLLRLGLGTGILAMPQAFAKSGLITGIIATICVAILVTHCLQVLIRSQYGACKVERVPLMSYPEAARVTLNLGPKCLRPLGAPSSVAIDFFLITYQLGVCCVYIVFVADNVKKLLDPHFVFSVEMHMLFQLPVLIALNMIPNLKMLAPFSGAANLATFTSLLIVIYYLLTMERSKEPLDLWGSLSTFPLFFGTIVFALTAVGVVVAIENNMKTPKSFGRPCGVLHIGMSVVTTLFIAIGYIGYIFCVSECRDVITLDLPPGPATTVAIILYVFAIFISYGLHCYVPVDMLWNEYILPRMQGASQARLKCCEISLRVGLGVLTFVVAVMVPRLGLFISLFGALCLSALGFCFPALMESCLWYPRPPGTARFLMFLKDSFLFVVGIIGLVSGTYSALLGIIQSFQ